MSISHPTKTSFVSGASYESQAVPQTPSGTFGLGQLKELKEPEGKLRLRDWMVGFCEFSLEFCFAAIMMKHSTEDHAWRSNLTPSALTKELLMTAGCSGIASLVFGYLGDSYIGNYSVAVFNVSLHFIVGCLYFIEAVLTEQNIDDDNVKAFTTKAWLWTALFTSATKYSRLAYPFEQLLSLTKSTITFYAFFITWTGRFGYFARMTAERAGLSRTVSGTMTFIFCGISLFLYANVLRPPNGILRGKIGTANEILGCLFASIYFRLRRRKRPANTTSLLDFAEYKYDKAAIAKTKRFFKFWLLMLPLSPILMFMFNIETLSISVTLLIKRTGIFYAGVDYVLHGLTVLVMPVIHFVALQFVRSHVNLRTNLIVNLIVGNAAALVALYGLALVIGSKEDTDTSFSVGTTRIFNAGNKPIRIMAQDTDLSQINIRILPASSKKVILPMEYPKLYKILVAYDKTWNFSTYMSVYPNKCTGYVITSYPRNFIRILGFNRFMPDVEGSPGLNDPLKATVYVVNAVDNIHAVLAYFVNDKTHTADYAVELIQGRYHPFQIASGTYRIMIPSNNLFFQPYYIGVGGVYGIILYTLKKDITLSIDVVRAEATVAPDNIWLVLVGLSVSLSTLYITLLALISIVAPKNALGLTFSSLHLFKDGTALGLFFVFLCWKARMSSMLCVLLGFLIGSSFFATLFVILTVTSLFRN